MGLPTRMFLRLEKRSFHLLRHSRRCMSSVVMSFGDGSQGGLGLPSSLIGIGGDAYEPMIVPGLPSDICSVSAGHYHSLAITSQGELWSWGRNREAQLGRGYASGDSYNEPKKVEGLNEVRVRDASASGVVSTAIGDDGSLWVWGKSKRGQLGLGKDVIEAVLPSRLLALAEEKIVKVSLGWGHALALTETGKLYGWGYASDGRLGQLEKPWESSLLNSPLDISETNDGQLSGAILDAAVKIVSENMEKEKDMSIIWEPTLMKDVHDVDVVDIACGFDHSLILCRNGTLLSNGINVYGQLGRREKEDNTEMLLPVVFNTGFTPVSVSSGLGHSMSIGEANDVVSWGWNNSHQLGREGAHNIPLVVEGLEGEVPISVSGGRVHSIALTAKKEVWVWGCGKNGRLGLGSSVDEKEPCLLECFDGCDVIQAVSGFDHNLVLVSE